MQQRAFATVIEVVNTNDGAIRVVTEFGPAIAYTDLVGPLRVGSQILINRTANVLKLGTGGFDFVVAVLDQTIQDDSQQSGHIIKLRYTPSQLAVSTLEERPELVDIWDRNLDSFPVVVCQLHSQIAHVAASVSAAGKRVVYIMTDSASLPYAFSNLARQLKAAGLLLASITAGQAFGGDFETVTVHSALLAAKYYLHSDVAIVAQGPGNAGTGTTYGFGGIDQANLLDIASALGGIPIAVLRASDADLRPRHRGISHHTTTVLKLVRSACTIPIPPGMMNLSLDSRHKIVEIADFRMAYDLLDRLEIRVTTMGRDPDGDRLFFDCSAAAGAYAASLGENN